MTTFKLIGKADNKSLKKIIEVAEDSNWLNDELVGRSFSTGWGENDWQITAGQHEDALMKASEHITMLATTRYEGTKFLITSIKLSRINPDTEIQISAKNDDYHKSIKRMVWGLGDNFPWMLYRYGENDRMSINDQDIMEVSTTVASSIVYKGNPRKRIDTPVYLLVADLIDEKVASVKKISWPNKAYSYEEPKVEEAKVETVEEVAPEKETTVIAGPASMQQSIVTDEWRARVQAALAKNQ